MSPIAILTYKHPKYEFIDRVIKKYGDNLPIDMEVYYFIYDMDFESFSDPKYQKVFTKLTLVKVPYPEFKTAQKMRLFIQKYMTENKIPKFWMLDNDIILNTQYIDEETNRITNIEMFSALEGMEKDINVDDYGLIGAQQLPQGLYGYRESHKLMVEGTIHSFFFVNNKKLVENGIWFTGDDKVAEDIEICINCKVKGIQVGSCRKYRLAPVTLLGGNGWYDLETLIKNTYEKYKHTGYIKLGESRDGRPKPKILKTPDLHIDLWD